MKKWSIDRGALRSNPNGVKLLDVPSGAILEATGNLQNMLIAGKSTVWAEVFFMGKVGWINEAFLEQYVEKFATFEVFTANPTPNPDDAEQYILVQGDAKHNLCGQFAVAFILGRDIDTLLKDWKEKSPDHYNTILEGTKDKTTGSGDLELILKLYGYSRQAGHILDFKAGLTDPVAGYLPSPGRLKKMLEKYALIAGVKMDGVTGKLRGGGIGHWVVLNKVSPIGKNNGNGGWVEIYNSFPNRREEYSYDEFTRSCGRPDDWTGIWVQRSL